MSLAWQCDRCLNVSADGAPPDELPEDWVQREMPVRGSMGARSNFGATLCPTCDDALYAWLHRKPVAE